MDGHGMDWQLDQPAYSRVDRELEVIGRDTRMRRKRTLDFPFRYICHLSWQDNGQTWGGTGMLIGKRTILTAGHNLIHATPSPGFMDPKAMHIAPGRDGRTRPFGTCTGVHFYVPEGFVRRTASGSIAGFNTGTRHDYGLVRLARPLGDTVGFWGERPRPADDKRGSSLQTTLPLPAGKLPLNLSGYPVDKPWGTQWSSYNYLQKLQGGLLIYDNDTFGGHSGSPVWVTRHPSKGGRNLVGVHIRRFRVDGRPKFNAAVHLSKEVMTFIRRFNA